MNVRNLLLVLALLFETVVYSTEVSLRMVPMLTVRADKGAVIGIETATNAAMPANGWLMLTNYVSTGAPFYCVDAAFMTSQSFYRVVDLPSLLIRLDPQSPGYRVVPAGTRQVCAVFDFCAPYQDVVLTAIGLRQRAGFQQSLSKVSIWESEYWRDGDAAFTNCLAVLPMNLAIQKGTTRKLTVTADLCQIDAVPQILGDLIKIDIDPAFTVVCAPNAQARLLVSYEGGVQGFRPFRTVPVVKLVPLPNSGLCDGRLMRWSIGADPACDVALRRLSIKIMTLSMMINTGIDLFCFKDSNYTVPDGMTPDGYIGSFRFDSNDPNSAVGVFEPDVAYPVNIPAGKTYFFEIRCGFDPIDQTYASMVQLLGDSDYSGFGEDVFFGLVPMPANFLWSSGNREGGSDLTNGYGVPGLPSGGLIQMRQN